MRNIINDMAEKFSMGTVRTTAFDPNGWEIGDTDCDIDLTIKHEAVSPPTLSLPQSTLLVWQSNVSWKSSSPTTISSTNRNSKSTPMKLRRRL